MPELPEVQNFRRLLLPLVSEKHPLRLERRSLDKAPPRKFIKEEEIDIIHSSELVVADVLRKGKLLCMVLKKDSADSTAATTNNNKYLFLHMGMTGRISNPGCIPKLQELSDTNVYPPPYTYLRLVAGPNEACFSDPRKFGAIFLKDSLSEDFGVLAPDAWTSTRPRPVLQKGLGDSGLCWDGGAEPGTDAEVDADVDANADTNADAGENPSTTTTIAEIAEKFTSQSMGIKGILLDQKRAVCGVGNWVADEVLYQTKLHPDQNYLTGDQARDLVHRLHSILDEAVRCLSNDEDFPREWLFHYRWSKRGSKTTTVKDAEGRSIAFVTSGGRTSAVVPSIQKKKSQKPAKASSSSPKQPPVTKPANKKKTTTTKQASKSSRRSPTIKSETDSKNVATTMATTKTKTKTKTTATATATAIKEEKEKVDGAKESTRNSGRKRKDAPGESAVVVRRGTRRSPRLAK